MDAEQAYLFRHAVLRDAAYHLWLPGDRAQLHSIAAQLLSNLLGDHAALEIARHARAALDGDLADAAANDLAALEERYLAIGAARAMAAYQNETALGAYLQLERVAKDRVRLGQCHAGLRELYERADQRSKASTHARRAVEYSATPMDRLHALSLLKLSLYYERLPTELSQTVEEIVALARTINTPAARAYEYSGLSMLASFERRRDDAFEFDLKHHDALMQSQAQPRSILVALSNLAASSIHGGDDGRTEALFQSALALAHKLNDLPMLSLILLNLSDFRCRAGRFAEAIAAATESGGICERLGLRFRLFDVVETLMDIRLAEGKPQEALGLIDKLEAAGAEGDGSAEFVPERPRALSWLGRFEEASRYLRSKQWNNNPVAQALVKLETAYSLLSQCKAPGASAEARAGLSIPRVSAMIRAELLTVSAIACHAMGDFPSASAEFAAAWEVFEHSPLRVTGAEVAVCAGLAHCLHRLGDLDGAIALAAVARERIRTRGMTEVFPAREVQLAFEWLNEIDGSAVHNSAPGI